jgi:hypothetical protein
MLSWRASSLPPLTHEVLPIGHSAKNIAAARLAGQGGQHLNLLELPPVLAILRRSRTNDDCRRGHFAVRPMVEFATPAVWDSLILRSEGRPAPQLRYGSQSLKHAVVSGLPAR